MEETLKKLSKFFTKIAQAETEADAYRTGLLSIIGGKRMLFK